MVTALNPKAFDSRRPVQIASRDFTDHKYEWYRWMLEEAPVCAGKITVLNLTLVSRYDDCRMVLTDERFVRNRGRARGKGSSPLPFPLPRSIAAMSQSMILEDDPDHRRLRNLVNRAFTPHAIAQLTERVETYSHELLDGLEKQGQVDLLASYARPIPIRVISEMMGVARGEADEFQRSLGVLTDGFSGLGILKTLFWDLRRASKFVQGLIAHKRERPGADILSGLIAAEEEGDRLSEQELFAMVFLLIVAGFETTLHLITNGVKTLLEHPDSLERLRREPALWESAVEELVRHRGPIHGTKLQYATEDVMLHDVEIKRGGAIMPLLAAANHDPRVFEKPDVFDIERAPNHHLGFGFGKHFCLGRQLALMETKIALANLVERNPGLRLAVDEKELELARMPGWHRYVRLPVILG
jgi:cytochrome P450